MRLRIFDWGSRWFWIVVFYKPDAYGEAFFSFEIFSPSKRMRWFHLWQWEELPQKTGYEEVEVK